MSKRWVVGGIWAILVAGSLLMFAGNAAAKQPAKVKVRDIKFIGNTFVSGARLATLIKSSPEETDLNGAWDKSSVEVDIGNLYSFYRSFGFQDVRISSELQWSSDRSKVTLIYHIEEGPRYRVREAPEVSSNPGLPGEQLAPLSQIKPGDYLDEEQVKADVKKITDYVRCKGWEPFVVPNPVWFFDSPGECNIRYEVLIEGKVTRPPCDRIAPCAAEPRSLPEHGVLSWPKPQRPSKDSSKMSKSKDTSSIR
jgi:outer membrane protein assembly factor BamA